MRLTGLVAVAGLLLVTCGLLAPVAAQEAADAEDDQQTQVPQTEDSGQATPDAEPDTPADAESAAPAEAEPAAPAEAEPAAPAEAEPSQPPAAAEPQQEKKKFRFSLFVEAGGGTVDAEDIDSSIEASSRLTTSTNLSIEDQLYARLGLGWKMPNEKGDFRLRVTNYREDEYSLTSSGLSSDVVTPPSQSSPQADPSPLPWWNTQITAGQLVTTRTPPVWQDALTETNPDTGEPEGDGFVQDDEITFQDPDVLVTRNVAKSMQNRVQFWDLLYGRTFGPRRFDARWWAGLRYFIYEGTIPGTAWLGSSGGAGQGYTDGKLLGIMGFHQQTSGFGPTAALEARYNAFNQLLQVYVQGQTAYLFMDIESNSQSFLTLWQDTTGTPSITLPANLENKRTKSAWQNTIDAGLRIKLKNGLGFEFAYNLTGFLDVILIPIELIPANRPTRETTAIYNTKDYLL
jgi:hypothetical protein